MKNPKWEQARGDWMNWWNRLANGLTISRMVLLPAFIGCMIAEQTSSVYGWYARGMILYMILSDLLDGIVARRGDRKNPIGQFIDPLADKLLVGAGYVLLSIYYGNPPFWVTGIVLGRFVVLRLLWLLIFYASRKTLNAFMSMKSVFTKPSALGKFASDCQMALLIAVLFPFPRIISHVGWVVVPGVTLAAAGLYIVRATREIDQTGLLADHTGKRGMLRALLDTVARGLIRWTGRTPVPRPAAESAYSEQEQHRKVG